MCVAAGKSLSVGGSVLSGYIWFRTVLVVSQDSETLRTKMTLIVCLFLFLHCANFLMWEWLGQLRVSTSQGIFLKLIIIEYYGCFKFSTMSMHCSIFCVEHQSLKRATKFFYELWFRFRYWNVAPSVDKKNVKNIAWIEACLHPSRSVDLDFSLHPWYFHTKKLDCLLNVSCSHVISVLL
jgi:hypothetical protein